MSVTFCPEGNYEWCLANDMIEHIPIDEELYPGEMLPKMPYQLETSSECFTLLMRDLGYPEEIAQTGGGELSPRELLTKLNEMPNIGILYHRPGYESHELGKPHVIVQTIAGERMLRYMRELRTIAGEALERGVKVIYS